jgi:hypothetical protein
MSTVLPTGGSEPLASGRPGYAIDFLVRLTLGVQPSFDDLDVVEVIEFPIAMIVGAGVYEGREKGVREAE